MTVAAPRAVDEDLGRWMDADTSIGFRQAVSWSVLAVGGQQAITALVSFVLAAIVGPAAFGTIAMAMVYVFFVQLLVRQGLVQALVQRKELHPAHVDSAFWMVLATSVVLGCASAAASGAWADANDLPLLQPVLLWLSLLVPIQGSSVVQESLLRRRMEFRQLAHRTVAAAGAGATVGLGMALAGAGVWALVGQQLAMAVATAIVLWRASPWRPTLRFSVPHARDLLGFSIGSSLSSLASFANSRSDALLIGLILGPIAVGLYRLAARMTEIVTDLFTRSVQQVLLPDLSRLQDRPEHFRARAVRVLGATSLVTVPLLGVLAATSEPLLALFGADWAPAARALQILCLVTAVRSVLLVNAAVLLAAGRPFVNASYAWCSGVVSVGAFAGAALLVRERSIVTQVSAIALARLAVHVLVLLPTQLAVVHRCVGLGVSSQLRACGSSMLAGGLAAATGSATLRLPPVAAASAVAQVLVAGAAATVVAGVALLAVDRAAFDPVLDVLRDIRAGRRREVAGPVEPDELPRQPVSRRLRAGVHRLVGPAIGLAAVGGLLLGTTAYADRRLEEEYRSAATLFIVGRTGLAPAVDPAGEDGALTPSNPLARARSGGNQRGAALVEVIDGSVALAVAQGRWSAGVRHEAVQVPRSPVVDLRVTAPSARESTDVLRALVQDVRADLEGRQADARPGTRFEAQVLRTAGATAVQPPRGRVLAVVVAWSLLTAFGAWSVRHRLRSTRPGRSPRPARDRRSRWTTGPAVMDSMIWSAR